MEISDPYELARYIKNAEKTTPIKAYLQGDLSEAIPVANVKLFGTGTFWFVVGDQKPVQSFLEINGALISESYLENDRRNSAIPLLDFTTVDARIEPGAFIRDQAVIDKHAVIMMGAVINIGAVVGEGSMIDMGAVLGGRATVGRHCHIGAGAVLAGVVEPASATPVIIEDDVLVGANAVVIEGVHVGQGAVVAAGAIVIDDVPAGAVVAGVPAKIIKMKDDKTASETGLIDALRKL